jgi:hypothetical protein
MSTTTKHTPRPWRVSGSVILAAIGTEGTWDDAYNLNAYGGAMVCESVKTEANGNLIAAAPDLLAACEEAVGYLDDSPSVDPVYKRMCAAIAKARGEGE